MAFSSTRIVWRGDDALRVTDAALARGENKAAERLRAIVQPFTPYLEGDLSRAYGVHQAAETAAGAEEGAQLQNFSPYAEFQHEGGDARRTIRKHTTDPNPLARTKFVEVPMRENRNELYAIIAAEVAGSLS